MKRKLALQDMSWKNVTQGLKIAIGDDNLNDNQATWISRTLPEVYKKIFLLIAPKEKFKISNSNIAGVVLLSLMRGEYEDVTVLARDVSADRNPAKLEKCNAQLRSIVAEIKYYNKYCEGKMELLDKMLQTYAETLLECEKVKATKVNKLDAEKERNAEIVKLENRLKKKADKLNEIYDSAAKDLAEIILTIAGLDKKLKKESLAIERDFISEDLIDGKSELKSFCCKLKAMVCRRLIYKIWVKEINESLDNLKLTIGDNIINGKFYLAKDTDAGDNFYSVYEPSTNITLELKVRKSYIRK